jgi:hypothetical protein
MHIQLPDTSLTLGSSKNSEKLLAVQLVNSFLDFYGAYSSINTNDAQDLS